MIRLLVVTNRPAPYRVPLFRALAEDPFLEVRVLYTAGGEGGGREDPGETGFSQVHRKVLPFGALGFLWEVLSFAPRVVVSGGFGLPTLLLFLLRPLAGFPLYIWSAETADSEASRGFRWGRRLARRGPLKSAAGFFVYGPPAGDFLRARGVSEGRIHEIGNPTDLERLSSVEADGEERTGILSVMRLERSKDPEAVLRVAASLKARGRTPPFTLVGEGSLFPRLERLRRGLRLDNVRLAGAVPRERMPALYRGADLLFHPARFDQWPHAINEAMHFGLPVVCSGNCGIPPDLVRDGREGYLLAPGDTRQAAESVLSLLDDAGKRREMGRAARASVARFTIQGAAERIAAQLRDRHRGAPPREGLPGRAARRARALLLRLAGRRVVRHMGVLLDASSGLLDPASRALILGGGWEREEALILGQALERGDRVLEAGACVGFLSLFSARQLGPGRVTAIEANPRAIRLMRRNMELNGLEIPVRNAALGEDREYAFHVSGRIASSSLERKPSAVDRVLVPGISLSRALEEFPANVLILDIEGAEYGLLTRCLLPPFLTKILVEFHGIASHREDYEGALGNLGGQGFRLELRGAADPRVHLFRRDPGP